MVHKLYVDVRTEAKGLISSRTRQFSMAMCKFIYISYLNRSFLNHIIVLCHCLQVDVTGLHCVVCGNNYV